MASNGDQKDCLKQICKSVYKIVEEAKDNTFKKKCLEIIAADDFSEFQDKLSSTLLMLYKNRHGGFRNRSSINTPTTTTNHDENKENPAQPKGYSPIRKRARKEPLRLNTNIANILPPGTPEKLIIAPQVKIILTPTKIKENIVRKEKPKKALITTKTTERRNNHLKNSTGNALNDEAEVPSSNNSTTTTNRENWSLMSPDMNILSPTCVDVTKLCDFINGGVNDEIDSWLSDETPCGDDRGDVMMADERKEIVVLDGNERRENCQNTNKQNGDEEMTSWLSGEITDGVPKKVQGYIVAGDESYDQQRGNYENCKQKAVADAEIESWLSGVISDGDDSVTVNGGDKTINDGRSFHYDIQSNENSNQQNEEICEQQQQQQQQQQQKADMLSLVDGTDFEEYLDIDLDLIQKDSDCIGSVSASNVKGLSQQHGEHVTQVMSQERVAAINGVDKNATTDAEKQINTMKESLLKTGFVDEQREEQEDEDSEDWLGEFENDDFWGQQAKESPKNPFDLEVVDLFQIDQL